MQLGFELFTEEAGNKTPPPPSPGYHQVAGFRRRHVAATEERGWYPVLEVIPDKKFIYEAIVVEMPDEYFVGDNGYGCACVHQHGVDDWFCTLYHILKEGIGRIVG